MTLDAITCPVCKMTSHNPNDIREGYCGNCRRWTTPVLTVREWDRVGRITPGDKFVPRVSLWDRLDWALFCPACLLPRIVPGHRLRGCR